MNNFIWKQVTPQANEFTLQYGTSLTSSWKANYTTWLVDTRRIPYSKVSHRSPFTDIDTLCTFAHHAPGVGKFSDVSLYKVCSLIGYIVIILAWLYKWTVFPGQTRIVAVHLDSSLFLLVFWDSGHQYVDPVSFVCTAISLSDCPPTCSAEVRVIRKPLEPAACMPLAIAQLVERGTVVGNT